MLRETVIQYPTFAARLGQNNAQKGALPVCSWEEVESMLPNPPPAEMPHTKSARLPTIRSGAEKASNHLTPSTPNQMITTCMSQNTMKVMAVLPGTSPHPPQMAPIKELSARPPLP